MKRRDVLKVGAVGAAAMAMPGCAPEFVPGTPPPPDSDGHQRFLDALDHQLGFIEHARFAEQYAAAHGVAPNAQIAENDALIRRMLRTLCITQGFRDLPPETQLHPAVQARIVSHMDEIDATVFDLTARLDAMTPGAHAGVQEALRTDGDLAMNIGEIIDDHAARAGMSAKRRRQLRTMMMQTAFRLKHTAPGAVIGEYTAKVERMREETADSAKALAIAERIAGKPFWQQQHQLAMAQLPAGQPAPTAAPGASPEDAPPARTAPVPVQPMPIQVQPPEKQYTVAKVGTIMMGIGVVVFGVSAAIASGKRAATKLPARSMPTWLRYR